MEMTLDSSVLQLVLNLDMNDALPGEQKYQGSISSSDRIYQARYNLRSQSRASNGARGSEASCQLNNRVDVPRATTAETLAAPAKLEESVATDAILERGTIDVTSLAKHMDSLTKAAASSCNETVDQGHVADLSYFVEVKGVPRSPFVNLPLPNDSFVPVDICKGVRHLYVTSQASNEVAVYKDDTFSTMLTLRNDFKFCGPRNVICVNVKNKVGSSTVIVLDDKAFNFFDEDTGKHVGRFLKGSDYRGLGHYACHGKGEQTVDYLVSLDISQVSTKGTTNVCIFPINLEESGMQLKKKIPINGNDHGCKFLTVISDCSTTGCESHVAIVTAMKTKKVFHVDLEDNRTNEMGFKIDNDPEFTFYCAPKSISFAKPSGICSDSLGNIIIADEETGAVRVFQRTGVLISTVNKSFNPVGLYLDESEGYLYIAAWKPGCVQKIKTR